MEERRRRIEQENTPAPVQNKSQQPATAKSAMTNPTSIFPHWDLIYSSVLGEFIAKKQKMQNDGAPAEDIAALSNMGPFSDLVARMVQSHPNWQVRPVDVARLAGLLKEAFFGMGQLTTYMALEGLEEIICNRYDEMFIVQNGKKTRVQSPFNTDKELVEYLARLFMPMGRELNRSNPAEDGHLPDGSRIHADIPPVAVRGACFSIRKFNPQPFTMDDYLTTDMFNQQFLDDLSYWMNHHMNIVVAGGTASGKSQPLDCKVLTPEGFKEIGQLEIGDKVLDPNGKAQYVTGVFPQGVKKCFEVNFQNGTTRCCDEHLWAVRTPSSQEEFKVKTLREIMDNNLNVEIPRYQNVEYLDKSKEALNKFLAPVFALSYAKNQPVKMIDVSECETPIKLNQLNIKYAHDLNERLYDDQGYCLDMQQRSGNELISIKQLDSCEMVCISVSGEDQLYVTDDYVITHNTTFLNAIGKALLPREDRLLIIEDNKELQIETEDYVYLQAAQKGSRSRTGASQDANSITIRDCLRYSLRLRPDRIIIGELRSHEAFDLLQALNTGHDGSMTTIHANSSRDAISRLASLAVATGELPIDSIYDLIARTINIILHVSRFRGTPYRKVMEAWQFFHEDEVAEEALDYYEELKAAGEVRRIRDQLMGIALYTREGSGEMVKKNEILPLVAKFSLRQDFARKQNKPVPQIAPAMQANGAPPSFDDNAPPAFEAPVFDASPVFAPPTPDLNSPPRFGQNGANQPVPQDTQSDLPPWEQ